MDQNNKLASKCNKDADSPSYILWSCAKKTLAIFVVTHNTINLTNEDIIEKSWLEAVRVPCGFLYK